MPILSLVEMRLSHAAVSSGLPVKATMPFETMRRMGSGWGVKALIAAGSSTMRTRPIQELGSRSGADAGAGWLACNVNCRQSMNVSNQIFVIYGAFLDAESGECYHQSRR